MTVKQPKRRARWHHRPWPSAILATLIAGYVHLLDRTGRWQLQSTPATEDLLRAGKPFILAFWHGRIMLCFSAWRPLLEKLSAAARPEIYIISSSHGDGRLIQRAASWFGTRALFGSSGRENSVKVLREAQKVLNESNNVLFITPDGPRGPRMRSQAGIAYLARRAKVPVVPIAFAARRQRPLGSWDRFLVIPPFVSGTLAFGEPIELPEEGDTESYRALIEDRLNALSIEIDRTQGVEPIEPAG